MIRFVRIDRARCKCFQCGAELVLWQNKAKASMARFWADADIDDPCGQHVCDAFAEQRQLEVAHIRDIANAL